MPLDDTLKRERSPELKALDEAEARQTQRLDDVAGDPEASYTKGDGTELPDANGQSVGAQGTGNVYSSTPELESHIRYADPSVPRNRGIGGAHNSGEFFKNDLNIVLSRPSKDIAGVTYHEYTMPLLGKDGKPVGGYGT